MSTANSETDRNNVLRLNLTSDLRLEDNLVSLSHCSIYYTWKNFKSEYGNTDFSYTDLNGVDLSGKNLQSADFTGADIENMDFTRFQHAINLPIHRLLQP